MTDRAQSLRFPTVVLAMTASIWAMTQMATVQRQAQRSVWPAADPQLFQRALRASIEADAAEPCSPTVLPPFTPGPLPKRH